MAKSPEWYGLLNVGGEGAELVAAKAMQEAATLIARGEPVAEKVPNRIVFTMVPPKSRKKMVDLMSASRTLLVSDRVKALFEEHAAPGEVELFPATVHDHAKKPVPQRMWVVNVVKTLRWFDLGKSDVERQDGLVRGVNKLEVSAKRPKGAPALFRLGPGTEYAWLFLRQDVAEALEAMKPSGLLSIDRDGETMDSYLSPI